MGQRKIMKKNRMEILRSSTGFAIATLMSRVLGLLRSMLEGWVLGDGALAAAWQFSFMLPNWFRRVLGEGALGQALIPLLAHSEQEYSDQEVRRQLGVIFLILGTMLGGIVVVVATGAMLLQDFAESEQGTLALQVIPLVIPYAFFICLVGAAGAVLNTKRIFFLPALGALLMNIFMILGLWLGPVWCGKNPVALLETLSMAVLLSGLLQLLLMGYLLWKCDRLPDLLHLQKKHFQVLKELWHLMLPGLLAASAVQLSFMVDQAIAWILGARAMTAINYADRIIYVPLGVFATALNTVLLADMSRAAARGDWQEFLDDLSLGLRYVCFLCIPSAIFIAFFRSDILRLLYLRQNFTEEGVVATAWAMGFYAIGIPFFCSIKMILPAFYARKDMRTPLKFSLIAIAINLVLNLIFMWPLKQGGIALATVCSCVVNNLLLLWGLYRVNLKVELRPVGITALKTLLASMVVLPLYWCYPWLRKTLSTTFLADDLLPLMLCGGGFCLGYLALGLLLRCSELKELLGAVLGRRQK